jgi:hypothetical protein
MASYACARRFRIEKQARGRAEKENQMSDPRATMTVVRAEQGGTMAWSLVETLTLLYFCLEAG